VAQQVATNAGGPQATQQAEGGRRHLRGGRRAEGARSCGARWRPCPARLRGRAQLARGLRRLADGCRPCCPSLDGRARESSRGFGFRKKRTGTKSIRNRTDNIASLLDRTVSGLTGDVARSAARLLGAGFLYRDDHVFKRSGCLQLA